METLPKRLLESLWYREFFSEKNKGGEMQKLKFVEIKIVLIRISYDLLKPFYVSGIIKKIDIPIKNNEKDLTFISNYLCCN